MPLGFFRLMASQLVKADFVKCAIRENADLSAFQRKPSGKMLFGLICIAVSYAICWPVISALGIFAIYVREPMMIFIGGPVIWTVAHFLCMFGLYLVGADHTKALVKWFVRIFVEKYAPENIPEKGESSL